MPAFGDDVGQFLRRLRADVEDHVLFGHFADRLEVSSAFSENSGATTTSLGSGTAPPWALILAMTFLRFAHQLGFGQALADGLAFGQQEGVGDAAADDQLIHLVGQGFQDGQLGWTPWSRRQSPPAGGPGLPAPCPARPARRQQNAGAGQGQTWPRRGWRLRRGGRCQRRR